MAKKALRKVLVLPPGRASYPFLAKPDEGREYSDGAWKFDHLVLKETWKKPHPNPKDVEALRGKTWEQVIQEAILDVYRDLKGDAKLTWADVKKHPLKDLASDPKTEEKMKPYMMMRVKNKNNQPLIVDINKKEMSQEEIAKIKGGDWVEPVVSVYSYSQSGGGVTFGLDIVRFIQKGEPFGLGASKHLGLLDDIEVTAEAFTDEEMAEMAG